jgi:hypothetical protein
MQVRGKFFVLSISKSSPQGAGSTIRLGAVGASEKEKSENNLYHRYTPSGNVDMFVDNPAAEAFFSIGKTVYVDFSEAPAE